MSQPTYTTEERHTRETFLALMWALSYPGRAYTLPDGDRSAWQQIGDTLLDLETSFYTPDPDLPAYLGRNGARALPPGAAAYHLYPLVDETALLAMEVAPIGTMPYPDSAATLFIGCTLGDGAALTLAGPGVPPGAPHVTRVAGVPAAFWALREARLRYPLGWDVILVSGRQVVGLPRTTQITAEGS